MLITAIADLHKSYTHLNLSGGDILIVAGDIDVYRYEQEIIHFNKWLGEQQYTYKIVVAGNHDGLIEDLGYGLTKKLLNNAYYLENTGIYLNGLFIWGSPYTPEFNRWSFMKTRGQEIKKIWDKIPDAVDILVTHGPPFGIQDQIPKIAEGTPGDHLGCYDLLQKIKQVKPKYHIFGHIHYSYGQTKKDGTTFINCSLLNEEYELVNKPVNITI